MPPDKPTSPSQPVGNYFQLVRREIEPFLPQQVRAALEIGCGAGKTMEWLRSIRSIDYAAGVELSPAAAGLARAVFDEVKVADVGSSAALDFGRDRFDLVLALDVLEHLPDPWTVLQRMRGKMAPNGVFIASIPNVAHYSVCFPLLFGGKWNYEESGLLDRTHLRFFTRETVISLFVDSGFVVQKVGTNVKFPQVFSLFGLSGRRWSWYNQKLMHTLFPKSNRFFDFQFLVSAKPSA